MAGIICPFFQVHAMLSNAIKPVSIRISFKEFELPLTTRPTPHSWRVRPEWGLLSGCTVNTCNEDLAGSNSSQAVALQNS